MNPAAADLLAAPLDLPAQTRRAVEEAADALADAAVRAVDQRLKAFAAAPAAPAAASAGGQAIPAALLRDGRDGLNGFGSAGEFWHAVAHAGTPGKAADPRLLQKAPSGLNTLEGSDGGFLAPAVIADRILELVFDPAGLLARTDSEAISGNSIALKALDESSRATGFRRGGVRGYWLAEAERFAASRPKFRELSLRPHKLGVFYYATDEELADASGLALEQKLAQYAAEEIDWLIGDAILRGDGVGKPLGILASDAPATVAKETSQAADTILLANVVKMYSRMLPRSLSNAVWLCGPDTLPQLLALAYPSSGSFTPMTPAGAPAADAQRAPFGTLLGRPVLVTEHNPPLGDRGDLVFADLGMYKTATRGGLRQAMSIHVRFDYGETAFRFDFRIDGAPWLQSPVSPANGGAAQSPFVVLEAR